jgi:hypothetical protein
MFIKFMHQRNIDPTVWTHNDIYCDYISSFSKMVPPLEQVFASANVLLNFAELYEVDVSTIFDHIPPNKLIELVQLKQISAWLLLFSGKFVEWHETLSEEQQLLLENTLRTDEWLENKSIHSELIPKVKEMVRELGL